MQITYCPQGPERLYLNFDRAQFNRRSYPVDAHYVGAHRGVNGWESTGLSFGDIGSMQTQNRKSNGRGRMRRLSTPAFMLDERRFRSVIIRFLEIRAGLVTKQSGTEAERMQRVSALLKQKAEQAVVNLDKFCALYVGASDDAERKRFQRRVEEYDTTIRIYREPWCIPQMCRAYYMEGLDSVGVSMRVGFKSDHIRQILYRLAHLDADMQAGTDAVRERKRKGPWQLSTRAHTRWHVNRGIASRKCAFCAIGSSETARKQTNDAQPLPQFPGFSGEELRA
jgi:hypothetical protein